MLAPAPFRAFGSSVNLRAALLAAVASWSGLTAQTEWRMVTPGPRLQHQLAYLPGRDRVVLWGGSSALAPGALLGDLWEWDGTVWRALEMSSASGPTPRSGAAMAMGRGKLVLFGGSDATSTYRNDTWEWDGAWVQRLPANPPDARRFAAIGYDPNRQVVVLCGGQKATGQFDSDTWTWDGTLWTRALGTVMTDRRAAAMAYLPGTTPGQGQMMLFGGQSPPGPAYADTWVFDGTNWTRHSQGGPPPRFNHALAYDPSRQRILLFGGQGDSSLLADTWEWDGSVWTDRTPMDPGRSPSPRGAVSMAFDPTRGRMVLHGGESAGPQDRVLRDTWEWDGRGWQARWDEPAPRLDHRLTFDSARGRVLLFGGFLNGLPLGDTWEWDGTRWSRGVTPFPPPPRSAHAMSHSAARGGTVLFGGHDGAVALNDTWTWSGNAWAQSQVQGPAHRSGHMLVEQPLLQTTLLFGGSGTTGPLNDMWEWNGLAWTPLTASSRPAARSGAALESDPTAGRALLFGGFGQTWLADLWEWNGRRWTLLDTLPAAGRANLAAAFDTDRRRLVLFGGTGQAPIPAETWEWHDHRWELRGTTFAPSARQSVAMVFDPVRRRCVLFGGRSNSGLTLGETWEYCTTAPAESVAGVPGCPGTAGVPLLAPAAYSLPWIDHTWRTEVQGLPLAGPRPILFLGLSDSDWQGLRLPFDLTRLGMNGCTLGVSGDHLSPMLVAGNSASWSLAIPALPALVGTALFLQAAVGDPGANAAGMVWSNSVAARIGAP